MKRKRELHQSEVTTYLKCGKQWEFRYVLGIKTPPSGALSLGSSVHAAIQNNFIHKIKTGEDAPKAQVLDTYSTDFELRADDTNWGEENRGKQKDLGAKLVDLHHTKLAPTISPAKVEEKFLLKTDAGYDLGGTIDLVETSGIVVDHKTAGKSYADDAITRALQPAIYDFAYEALFEKKSKGFRYDILLKKSEPEIQQVTAKVTKADRTWAFDTVTQVFKAMEAGIAMPAAEVPGVWWCSEKFCGYWNMCKGKDRKKPTPKPVTKIDGLFPIKRSAK